MKKEEKEHILEEISAIQNRLHSLTEQLAEELDATTDAEATDEIRDEDIPVVYIETVRKEESSKTA